MRTHDLIAALAADTRRPGPPPLTSQAMAVLGGAAVSIVVMLAALGLRPDIMPALATWRFELKLVIVAVALALALVDCVRLASPTASGFASRWSLAVPVLLAASVGVELVVVSPDLWPSRLVGSNAWVCLTVIPLLSIAPLALGLQAMRFGAPASPAAAGAAVGRLAAAVGAAVYAVHCFDDSPLFVAVWYSLSTLSVILAGALLGRHVLRW